MVSIKRFKHRQRSMEAQAQTRRMTRAAAAAAVATGTDAKNIDYYKHMDSMKEEGEMHHAWEIQTEESNRTWYVVAETKGDFCVAERKKLRQLLRHASCGFNCEWCAGLAHAGVVFWGRDGPLMFQGHPHGLELVNSCRDIAERVMRVGQNAANYFNTIHLRLLTADMLKRDQQTSGTNHRTGEQYQHFTPQAPRFHVELDEDGGNRERQKDQALQTLTTQLHHYIQGLLESGGIKDLRERAENIESCLKNTTYGMRTYGHAIKWVRRILLQVHARRVSDWNRTKMVDKIPILAEALLSGNTGPGDDGKGVVCFPLQQANGALKNWLLHAGSKAEMQGLINATLAPKNYKQRDPEKAPTVKDIERTQEVFGNLSIRAAGLGRLKRACPNDTWLSPYLRDRHEIVSPTRGSVSGAFAELLREAAAPKAGKKHTIPAWGDPPETITSIEGMAEHMAALPAGWRVEINTLSPPGGMSEAGCMAELGGVENRYFAVKPTAESDDKTAFGWSFLRPGSAHGTCGRSGCTGGWKGLRGVAIIRKNDSAFLVTDDAEKLWRMHGILGRQQCVGAWVLSSQGERSHGQNFVRVLEKMTVGSTTDVADIPVIGNGISRSSKAGHENELHICGSMEWRVVDAAGRRSAIYRVKYFYKPETRKPVQETKQETAAPTGTVVEKLQSLIQMHKDGHLNTTEFNAAKTALFA